MRSISVLKILQIIMGLTGIFIVILGVGYLGELKGGFLTLLINNPMFAGLLTGFPLIPLIHSSKQKFIVAFYDEITQADYESGMYQSQNSYEIPLNAWLWKTRSSLFQETQPSADIKASVSWTDDMSVETMEGGSQLPIDYDIINKFGTSDSVNEFQTSYPIHLFWIETAVDSNDSGALYQETKIGGPGIYFEAGQIVKCNLLMNDTSNDTTGLTNIVSEAVFIVACMRGSHDTTEEIPPWVHIVGETNNSAAAGFSWIANSNMRIVNLRVTLWNGIDVSNQGNFVVDKHAPDLTLTADALELHSKPFLRMMFPLQDGTGAGTTYAPINTAYARGPHYLKKGEFLQFRHESVNSVISIHFQYIPDYGYTAEFNRNFTDSDYTDNEWDNTFLPMFNVPYDMYVTTVKGAIKFITDNVTSDFIADMELMGFKGGNYLDSTDLLLTYAGANVRGNILGAGPDQGQKVFSLKTINLVAESSDSTTNNTFAGIVRYAEAIADFYPRGAVIGFWIPSDFPNNIATLEIEMKIEALNRVKTTNAGTQVFRSDMLAVHTQ